jgi:hypothetical protein
MRSFNRGLWGYVTFCNGISYVNLYIPTPTSYTIGKRDRERKNSSLFCQKSLKFSHFYGIPVVGAGLAPYKYIWVQKDGLHNHSLDSDAKIEDTTLCFSLIPLSGYFLDVSTLMHIQP